MCSRCYITCCGGHSIGTSSGGGGGGGKGRRGVLCLLAGVRFCIELMYVILCPAQPTGFSGVLQYVHVGGHRIMYSCRVFSLKKLRVKYRKQTLKELEIHKTDMVP